MIDFKNMKVVTKVGVIIAAFSFLAIVLIGVAAQGLTTNQHKVASVLSDQEQSLYLAALAAEKKTRMHQEAFEVSVETTPTEWPKLQEAFLIEAAEMRKLLNQLRPLMDGEDLRNFQQIERSVGQYTEQETSLYSIRRSGDLKRAEDLLQGDMAKSFKAMDSAFDALIQKQDHDMDQAGVDIAALSHRTLISMLSIGVLGLLATIAAGVALARTQISRPVVDLTRAMSQLAQGDHGVAVPGLGRRDEIGAMAEALGVFKDAAVAKVRLEGETVAQRDAADRERTSNDQQRATAAREQKLVVESLASGLSRLAGGDLIQRLDQPFAPEYEQLRSDFNAAITKLQETMRTVAASASTIRSGAGEISGASDDLSRRTEQQAASLEETAAALDEITATVRKTAEGSAHARTVVGEARGDAEQSGEIVRQAVGAMVGIEQSSRQIGQIISVIDEIAFQTNLLALNAGVEAARAGEAGRGFAVVASEVRALAQRSAEAAKEIKGLVQNADTQVASGVALVNAAGQALQRIVAKVQDINTVVSEIAASAQEQASGLQQVNGAVNQMDQVTQQNAAMVEQSTAAAHSLTEETEDLARRIATFRIVEGGARGGEISLQARHPASRLALKTLGRGGAAAKPAAQETENSWEEF